MSALAQAAIWYESYARAEEALRNKQWKEAIRFLDEAIELKPKPDARARTYGLIIQSYFPYLRLGQAYFGLGQLDLAIQALDTEEQFNVISRSPSDLALLRQLRDQITAAKEAGAEAERERIRARVLDGLKQAGQLESRGQWDAALVEVEKALAIAPDDREARIAQGRLQARIAQISKQRDQETRAGLLAKEGEAFLSAGQFEAASGKFMESLSLAKSERVQKLLDSAQDKLRGQALKTNEGSPPAILVDEIISVSEGLEDKGQLEEALANLQRALAFEPGNARLLGLKQRILSSIAGAAEERSRAQKVRELLSAAQRYMADGKFAEAIASANQVLALEPDNGEAKGFVTEAYHELSMNMLGGVSLAPVISFIDDQGYDFKPGYAVERIRRADFTFSGSVVHRTGIEVVVLLDHYASPGDWIGEREAGAGSQKARRLILKPGLSTGILAGDLQNTQFKISRALAPGLSAFSLVVTEPATGAKKTSRYFVYYDPPFYLTARFRTVLLGLALALAGVSYGLKKRRRALALKRHFNPYVAGAPVLQDDLFFGREPLLQKILQTIHNNSIMLFGERRIGKTTLQHHLKKRLSQLADPEYAFFAAFIDLQGVTQERFFVTLRDEICSELAPYLQGFKTVHGSEDDTLYGYRELARDLVAILTILAARTSKKIRLVLLIDEVDQLNTYDPKVNQRLRSLFMRNFAENLVAVVSGVSIRKHWDGEGSPWYNFFEEIEVKPFLNKDAEELIERPIRGIFKLEKGVTERIIASTGCRPYLIQKLCVELVDRMHQEGRRTITVGDVEAVSGRAEN